MAGSFALLKSCLLQAVFFRLVYSDSAYPRHPVAGVVFGPLRLVFYCSELDRRIWSREFREQLEGAELAELP
jgi:hypothetical protein